jgi:hypothetical protein
MYGENNFTKADEVDGVISHFLAEDQCLNT